MNTPTQNPQNPTHEKHLGYWLRTIDVLMAERMHERFAARRPESAPTDSPESRSPGSAAGEPGTAAPKTRGLRRGGWRILNLISEGGATVQSLRESLPPRHRRPHDAAPGQTAGRAAGHAHPEAAGHLAGHEAGHAFRHGFGHPGGHRHGDRLATRIGKLVERGWISVDAEGVLSLTATGEEARAQAAERMQAFRAELAAGISEDDWATTQSTLKQIAINLGYDPENPVRPGRGHGHGHGFGRGHGRGHGIPPYLQPGFGRRFMGKPGR